MNLRQPKSLLFALSCAALLLCACGSKPAGDAASSGGAGAAGPSVGGGFVSGGTAGAGTGGAVATGGSVAVGGSGGVAPGTGGILGSEEVYPIPENLPDEDGSELWLRYREVPIPGRLAEYQAGLTHLVVPTDTASPEEAATLSIAGAELSAGLSGLTGASVAAGDAVLGPGAVVVGTPQTSSLIAELPLAAQLPSVGDEGYVIEATTDAGGNPIVVVAANTARGALYGSFALLRHAQTHSGLEDLAQSSAPKIEHRLLNHWDNLDRSVERGYAGQSLWDWDALPGTLSARYTDYARANASLGINGTVLTNVNANAQVLTASYLAKVKALADVFRPYGIRVYLTARFSAPIEIGGLNTADPIEAAVKQWWVDKADEIYGLIPDFGGFLVKANSEGQPGPQDYGRTHADGANMLAQALAPHGGIVMWRAFVYAESSPVDRIREAYDEFHPLDGQFEANVLVQPKNGPLDFQPREPFHPLLGGMPQTPLALELQVTKEYLGQDTHLAFLAPQWEEILRADTYANGPGSTVARVVDGSLHGYSTTAIAGVANIGSDANWTGSHMNQANWYAFGRMAWNPDASAAAIAEEWVRQTFSNDPVVVEPGVEMLLASHQAVVDYMTPLGLVHIMATDHHYGPGPWVNDLSRAEWNPFYYHKADAQGIGFDRTATGSNAVEQYHSEVGQAFASRDAVSDDFLLFFHRVGWQETLASGRTVWEELVHRYSQGVDDVSVMREAWASILGRVDAARYDDVADFLEIQHYEARWWRDACLSYFGSVGGQAMPAGYDAPANDLSFYQNLSCPPDVTKPRCTQVYTGTPSPAITP